MNEVMESKDQNQFDKIKKILTLLLGLNLIGWLNAFYALWHRQSLFANGLFEKSFCHVNEFIDCDSVAFSRYSSVLGMPTANWGMMFYAVSIIFILSAYFAAQDRQKESVVGNVKFLFLFNIVNSLITIVFAGISVFNLGTLCLICLLTYFINLASLIVVYKAKVQAIDGAQSSDSTISPLSAFNAMTMGFGALIIALHLLAPKMVNNVVAKATLDDSTIATVLQKFRSQVPFAFNLANSPTLGLDTAPIVVTEFSDFQCPYCAVSAKTMPSFLKAYEGKVKYSYKYYPLDSSCNPKMDRAAHPLACKAAKTAYCVFKEKGSDSFFKYKEKTFLAQLDMSPESLVLSAKELGIEASALKTCVDDPATHQAILDNVNEGVSAKVEGTPAIFVNGRMVETGPNPQVLALVFAEVLKSLGQ